MKNTWNLIGCLATLAFFSSIAVAAEVGLPQFSTSAERMEFRFQNSDFYSGVVKEDYTLTFKEQRGDRLIFTRREQNGNESETIYTTDMGICQSGSTAYTPCAPRFVFPMEVGKTFKGEYTVDDKERIREGKITAFESLKLKDTEGKDVTYPAFKYVTTFRLKVIPPGVYSGYGNYTETYYYCSIPPVGILCYNDIKTSNNTALYKLQLVSVKKIPAPIGGKSTVSPPN
ncbi:MAG: hypothetical protein A3J06_01430 [Candidatus Moranbacteria bacterium RIFCSPLOWO2_02_FULL_48_19]|nr:MAG: hypothetical protein A3J06_01430 [Candidatus Moranbacteria bacterium RIFCSPLOWO2_02_FULL_48_19]OGI30241.1 MAG: hypothetical protein A3G09_02775 [Candidatus Moranbacteria bacterium RIFCSPLOWO2_12_FULL_48_12]